MLRELRVLILLCLFAVAQAHATDDAAKEPKGGSKVERAAEKTHSALKKAADSTERGLKKALSATEKGINTAGKKTGEWLNEKTK